MTKSSQTIANRWPNYWSSQRNSLPKCWKRWKFTLESTNLSYSKQIKIDRHNLQIYLQPFQSLTACLVLFSDLSPYCNIVWFFTYTSNLCCLIILQKRVIRLINPTLMPTLIQSSKFLECDVWCLNLFNVWYIM